MLKSCYKTKVHPNDLNNHQESDHQEDSSITYDYRQMLYTLLCDSKIRTFSWITRLTNGVKWRLFEDILPVSLAKNIELEQIEAVLRFIGFDKEEVLSLSLSLDGKPLII